jgi:hypothetical protein
VPAGVQSPPFTMVEPHGGLLRIWRSNGKKDELHKRTETEGPYVKRSEGLGVFNLAENGTIYG